MNWWRTGSVYSSVCVLCILFEIEKSSVYPLIYAFSLNENENVRQTIRCRETIAEEIAEYENDPKCE